MTQRRTARRRGWHRTARWAVGPSTTTRTVQLRFSICDCPNDSVTEAGIDDLRIDSLTCSNCPDLDGDGVGTTDLLMLLAACGSDPGGPPDLDSDGNVGVTDLLMLVAEWGSCS